MKTFFANRAYDADLDVRSDDPLASLIQQEPPAGVAWLLLAPRRGRKTWTLRGLQRQLRGMRAQVIDLQIGLAALPNQAPKKGFYFLFDEPNTILCDPAQAAIFVQRCATLQKQHTRIVIAVTPAECQRLLDAGQAHGLLSEKAILPIQPLSPSEAHTLAGRSAVAQALLGELPMAWRRSAFLLELLFELQEKAGGSALVRDVIQAALDECRSGARNYFYHLFQEGLLPAQRDHVRVGLRGSVPTPQDLHLLVKAGMLCATPWAGRYELTDPVMAAAFAPLRIHHVSDVHIGPNSAQTLDAKDKGPLSIAADHGAVRDSYTQHLQQLAAQDQAPHLIVVSGDLTEFATDEQLAIARAWLDGLRPHLAKSPLLDDSQPRILLVGGNHDVRWSLALGGDPRSRHKPFAQTFAGWPHPALDTAPENRPVATASYPDFGIEFLLLGSAELGGEIDEAREKELLLYELATFGDDPTAKDKAEQAHRLALKAARIDPGLVHASDLQHAAAHGWRLPIRIAVLHHPVSPLPTSTEIAQYAGLLNAGAVKDLLLSRSFCLVLHGHAHTAWFGREHWPELHEGHCLHIASAPSLSSREVSENHGYNALELHRDYDDRGNTKYTLHVTRKLRKGQFNWQDSGTMPVIQKDESASMGG